MRMLGWLWGRQRLHYNEVLGKPQKTDGLRILMDGYLRRTPAMQCGGCQ